MSSLGWTGSRHTEFPLIVIVGGLLPTHGIMFVLCFKTISMTLYIEPWMTLGGMDS